MDSSLLTQQRRFAAAAASPKLRASDTNGVPVSTDIRAGRGPFFYNSNQVPLASSAVIPIQPIDGTQPMLCSTMDSALSYAAMNNFGPTVTSRFMYIWSMSIATAYNWVTGSSPYTGITDGWAWSTTYTLPNQDFVSVWMTQCLVTIMPTLIPAYNPTILVTQERTCLLYTSDAADE